MRITNIDTKKLFYVVQFIELPFKGIENYVCVPKSWMILRRSYNGKVVVTYPENEDPFVTRDRVKRKEKPDEEWRLYMARMEYNSENYQDAELWIATKNGNDIGEEKSEIRDTQPKPKLNKKLRRAGLSFSAGLNSDKSQLKAKPNKKIRKPLPRILIKRPLSQKSDKNLNNKRLKLNENANRGAVTDHTIIASGCSKQEQSLIMTKTSSASNGEMNTEQSTQPGVIKENQSVKMSIQSTSTKLTAEQHPSSNLLAQQQLSQQPTTDQKPSPHPTIDRQPSPNLINEQHPLSKLSAEQQPSPIGQDDQQPLSMPVIDINESNEDIDSCQNDLPEPVTHQPSQHLEQFQLPIFPVSSTLNSELRSAELVGKKSIKVAGHHHTPYSQYLSTPSTSYNGANLRMPFEPVAKKQSAALNKLKNPFDKKTRLDGNSKTITTMQYPLSSMMQLSLPGNPAVTQTAPPTKNHFRQTQVNGSLVNDIRCRREEKCINQKVPVFQGIVNTSAEQNFSKLAHQYRSSVGESHQQQYVPTQADYLQQFAYVQDLLKRQIMTSAIDQRVYHQNAILNERYVVPNPINQPVQLPPQNEYQYIPVNSAYAKESIRHDLMRGPADGAHTTYKPNVQNGVNILVDRYLPSQLHQNSAHPQQTQYPLMYGGPSTGSTQNDFTLESKQSSYMPEPQKITDRKQSLSTSKSTNWKLLEAQRSRLLLEQGIRRKMNPNSTQYRNMNLSALPEILTVDPAPSAQDAEVQTMTLSEIPHQTQITLIQRNHTKQLPRTNKTMLDQATETDLMIDVDHCIDKITGSSDGERATKLVDSACQTGEWLIEEQGLTYQETASDSETAAEQEIESENELDSEVHEKNSTNVRNVISEDQQVQYRIFAEQDMLNAVGTLVTRMGTNLSITREIFNFFRNSALECIQEYETLLEKVDKFNSIGTLPIPIPKSPPNKVTSQERPAGDNDNNTGVGEAVTPIREQKFKFSLPAEYDPNDTKWTLKYREKKLGLVELMPRTGVYVGMKELNRCIRQSNNCRTLARLLLTEIFSQNALSVCSLTGGKAKDCNSVKIDVRPGLDENAMMVLLAFVEEHGNEQDWVKFDPPAVMSSIQTKINDIRAKHGQTYKV